MYRKAFSDESAIAYEFPVLGIVSAWFGVFLILLTAINHIGFARSVDSWSTPIVESLGFVLVALTLASLLYLTIRTHNSFKIAALPLIINMGTFIIIRFVPFTTIWQETRLQWQWQSYNEVVQMVETGRILPDEDGLAALPFSLRHLSKDGYIMVKQHDGATYVFFTTKRFTAWNFSGYMYRSDNTAPTANDFNGQWRHVTQKRPYWYICTAY